MADRKKLSFFFIIIAGLAWGTSPIFVNYLAPYGITSLQMTAVRGTVSFLCMLIYVLTTNRKLLKTSIRDLFLYFFIGLTLFGTAYFYFTSMQLT